MMNIFKKQPLHAGSDMFSGDGRHGLSQILLQIRDRFTFAASQYALGEAAFTVFGVSARFNDLACRSGDLRNQSASCPVVRSGL